MNHPIQSTLRAVALIVVMTGSAVVLAGPPSKDEDPVVRSAAPDYAVQGERKSIVISGENFALGANVRFLVAGTKDSSQIDVLSVVFDDENTLTAEIQVLDTATVSDYDIEVRIGSRKGKGTTFRVESSGVSPSECNYDFAAELCDAAEADPDNPPNGCGSGSSLNGLRSDGVAPYPAIGGMGFRLDTNGSMKLEGAHDDRKITVDFAVHGCDAPASPDPSSPSVAAGFCLALKGSDMRIEHQVQERYGLCVLEVGERVPQAVVVTFAADDGGTLIDPDRKGQGPEPLVLDYGCRGNQLGTDYYRSDWRATVTRHSEYEWSIVGTTACLHTQLGELWDDGSGDPVRIDMPFHIHMTRLDAPLQ